MKDLLIRITKNKPKALAKIIVGSFLADLLSKYQFTVAGNTVVFSDPHLLGKSFQNVGSLIRGVTVTYSTEDEQLYTEGARELIPEILLWVEETQLITLLESDIEPLITELGNVLIFRFPDPLPDPTTTV